MSVPRGIVPIALALVVAGTTTVAQTRQPLPAVPAASTSSTPVLRDISGFWALSSDSRKVPQARLLPRVTKALIDLHARQDVHAMRWCNVLGMPLTMDSGSPIDIRQGPTSIIIAPENSLVPRYVYLNRKHVPADVYDPSTNGDSIANWEGDTLVVDTIGLSAKSYVDNYRTPHTEKLHVVERWKLTDDKTLQVMVTVDDPDTFNAPWQAIHRYRRIQRPAIYEEVCAENNQQMFDYRIPVANKPDF